MRQRVRAQKKSSTKLLVVWKTRVWGVPWELEVCLRHPKAGQTHSLSPLNKLSKSNDTPWSCELWCSFHRAFHCELRRVCARLYVSVQWESVCRCEIYVTSQIIYVLVFITNQEISGVMKYKIQIRNSRDGKIGEGSWCRQQKLWWGVLNLWS